MAESRTRSRDGRRRDTSRSDDRKARSDEDGRSDDHRRSDEHGGRKQSFGAKEIARRAMEQVVELTGREADGVTALERTDEGWRVGVEIVETRRIPDSADILATYEVELDGSGELAGYRRLRRYPRSHVDRER